MGVPISFNGNLAGHLGLGQHCNVNVMQPISRIIVRDGLIAAATIRVNSVAAVIAMMDGYAVEPLQSGEFNQCPSVARMTLQTKQSNKRGSKKEHDRNEMDVCVPHLQEGVVHVLLKGGLQRCQLTQRPFCLHMASDLHAASAVFGPYKMSCLNISAHSHFVFLADMLQRHVVCFNTTAHNALDVIKTVVLPFTHAIRTQISAIIDTLTKRYCYYY